MKNLPLGQQTFKDIIDENKLYVDKTKEIYTLISNNEGKYYFLSRPRRFGKSLLVSTLKEIFLGNKELFKGLWIYDKIEWSESPIIHIDFTDMLYTEGIDGFKISFLSNIKRIGKSYNIELEENNYKDAFKELIINLSVNGKVVILIDEYDKPIVNFIENIEIANKMKDILKNFYETIKSNDEYIKFAFLTGVSKFAKLSVFSGLNNLRDITLEEKFSTITGYTENELFTYFNEYIKETSLKLEIKETELKDDLKTWYNGYSWDGVNFVYNPFSILSIFTIQELNNYWFKSGTPTLLIKLIKEKNIDIKTLENLEVSTNFSESFELDNINIESLLFQTGYLTIKKINSYDRFEKTYILNYPNLEVKESMNFLVKSNK